MRKKKGLIFLSALIMITSITLLISKPSYATEPINYCVDEFNAIKKSSKLIEKIEGISLPQAPEALIESEKSTTNLGPILMTRANFQYFNPNGGIYYINYARSNNSPEVGYLLTKLELSDDEIENNYYQQLLLFWAMDRLAGYEDEYNYINENGEIIILPEDESTTIIENNIPASIKKDIKSQPVGTKMLNYLEEWENYVNWNLQENKTMEMDQINLENITYTVTDEYIETNLITPANKNKPYEKLFDSYQVEISEPFEVVNSKGKEQTTFKSGEGFKVRIPTSKIHNNKLDYTINITGIYSIPISRIYNSWAPMRIENSSQKDILQSKLYDAVILKNCITENKEESTITINYSKQVGNLNIKVIDAETKENLSNAEIAIYDSFGNIVYRINTTSSEINVTLPVGDYTVKQTITPPNYQARVVEQKVTVTENKTTEAVLENIQLVEVPDLGRRTTGIIMIIGSLALAIGTIIITYILKNSKA